MVGSFSWTPRYRREYEDWTLEEKNVLDLTFFITAPYKLLTSSMQAEADPTCRKPDETEFCGCLDLGLYNVIDVETLPFYDVNPDGCTGRPLDINVVCGRSGPDPEGNQPIDGGVTMYFTPRSDTVPVIDNKAYDTTNLPAPPAGKINVIKVHSGATRNDIRYWVCDHLKFATITDPSEWPSQTSSSSSSGNARDPNKALTFNWPYNDLYFSRGCPGGDTVNLVPC